MDQLNAVTKNIDSSVQKLILANLTLENIKAKTLTLKDTAVNLKQNSTKLQERNVEGKIFNYIILFLENCQKRFEIISTIFIYRITYSKNM